MVVIYAGATKEMVVKLGSSCFPAVSLLVRLSLPSRMASAMARR